MVRRGFTLVEVLVALVILEVGLLGVAGTLVVASRTVARASLLERGVGALEAVVDSLSVDGAVGSGGRPIAGGWVTWTVTSDGAITAAFTGADDDMHVTVRGHRAW